MVLNITLLRNFDKIRNFSLVKRNFTASKVIFNKPPRTSKAATSTVNVPGLSQNVVKVTTEPVGPGASKSSGYKNPEYFCYDKTSYFEAEVEMLKYRCPQPSVYKYYQHTDPK
ncbi:uncharacterized protein LOC143191435 [Rhynchophorus ferrugineus]|uniref:uncharacterized protein LOC143191435 n=1 Tax=Rhynchophorus ferrugineus TaxID=354439 RepID=UPI003FCEB17B